MKEKNYEKLYLFVKEEFEDFFENEASDRCTADIKFIVQYLDNCKQLKDYKLKKYIEEDDPWSPIYYNIKNDCKNSPMLAGKNVKLSHLLSGLYVADFLTMLFLNHREIKILEEISLARISSDLGYEVSPDCVINFNEIINSDAYFKLTLDFTPMKDRLTNIFNFFITYLYNKIDYRYLAPTLIKDLDLDIINPRKRMVDRKSIKENIDKCLEGIVICKTFIPEHETIIKITDPFQSFILSFLLDKYGFKEVYKEV